MRTCPEEWRMCRKQWFISKLSKVNHISMWKVEPDWRADKEHSSSPDISKAKCRYHWSAPAVFKYHVESYLSEIDRWILCHSSFKHASSLQSQQRFHKGSTISASSNGGRVYMFCFIFVCGHISQRRLSADVTVVWMRVCWYLFGG